MDGSLFPGNDIDWSSILCSLDTDDCYIEFINVLSRLCYEFIPQINKSAHSISKFHRERKTLMKKRTKLAKPKTEEI